MEQRKTMEKEEIWIDWTNKIIANGRETRENHSQMCDADEIFSDVNKTEMSMNVWFFLFLALVTQSQNSKIWTRHSLIHFILFVSFDHICIVSGDCNFIVFRYSFHFTSDIGFFRFHFFDSIVNCHQSFVVESFQPFLHLFHSISSLHYSHIFSIQ